MHKVKRRDESALQFAEHRDKAIIRCQKSIGRLEVALAELLILREGVEDELSEQRKCLKQLEEIDSDKGARESRRLDGRYVQSLRFRARPATKPGPVAGEEQYETTQS